MTFDVCSVGYSTGGGMRNMCVRVIGLNRIFFNNSNRQTGFYLVRVERGNQLASSVKSLHFGSTFWLNRKRTSSFIITMQNH